MESRSLQNTSSHVPKGEVPGDMEMLEGTLCFENDLSQRQYNTLCKVLYLFQLKLLSIKTVEKLA